MAEPLRRGAGPALDQASVPSEERTFLCFSFFSFLCFLCRCFSRSGDESEDPASRVGMLSRWQVQQSGRAGACQLSKQGPAQPAMLPYGL